MSNLLVVFVATGNQGSSVIDDVLNDPLISNKYEIRAITLDLCRPEAQALRTTGKTDVVQGDADSADTLTPALVGAHTVYCSHHNHLRRTT